MKFLSRLSNYFSQRDRGWLLSLVAVVCLIYIPYLGNPFFFDDVRFLMGGAAQHYTRPWLHFDLRCLSYATLGWTEMLFSNEAPDR